MAHGQRYTARGGDAVEARVGAILERASGALDAALPSSSYRSLLLIGGYGRGEGGVEMVAGEEHPHNNLDLLLVAREHDPVGHRALRVQAESVLEPVARECGIGLDLGIVSERTLLRSRCLVMWHDMRFGHRCLLGDASFAPSLSRFTPEAIDPTDVRSLLVNRGTLLVINDLLLEGGDRSTGIRRTVVKHAMKAVIGYGDALLFAAGRYHWSYAEKQARMRDLQLASADFRALYDQAVEFRFQPDYAPFASIDLEAWNAVVRAAVQPAHLAFEAARIGAPVQWDGYLEAALRGALTEGGWRPAAIARRLRNAVRASRTSAGLGWLASAGIRCAGPHGVLPAVFPTVAYNLPGQRSRAHAANLLGAPTSDAPALRRAYLEQWGAHGDVNFRLALARLGVSTSASAQSVSTRDTELAIEPGPGRQSRPMEAQR